MKVFYDTAQVKLYQADVLEWALDHKKKIDAGDALPFMATVTDPPYGLSEPPPIERVLTAWLAGDEYEHNKGGMMGKSWDNLPPDPRYWRALLDITYPGGYLFAFSGTRTADLLGISCRLGGWEPFDRISHFAWVQGCIDDQTEVLTADGWTHYREPIANKQILCYNVDNDTFSWERPERIFVYDYEDTAYRIKSDFTDQLVSKGHRCLVEQKGNLVFQTARWFNAGQEIRVPVLENLPDLLKALSGEGCTCSAQGQDLFSPLCQQSNRRRSQAQAAQANVRTGHDLGYLQNLRNGILQVKRTGKKIKRALLQLSVYGKGAYQGVDWAFSQRASGVVRGGGTVFQRKDERGKQSRLAGGDNLPKNQGCLWLFQSKIRQMSRRIFQYGKSKNPLCGRVPLVCGATVGTGTDHSRDGTPYRSQSRKQQPGQSDAFQNSQRSQIIRGSRFTTAHLAIVQPEYYKGLMWCPQVPSGAFVARRNGKIFITGNSGMKKGADVGKALDKEAGAEREVTGPPTRHAGQSYQWGGEVKHLTHSERKASQTAPATPLAQVFNNYGTGLAPKHEPILLFRKPREGRTFAQLAREFGSGALDIDSTRVNAPEGIDDGRDFDSNPLIAGNSGNKVYGAATIRDYHPAPGGRWPPNTHFSHVPHSEICPTCDGARFVESPPFTKSFKSWYTKTRDYGGTREEWQRLREGSGSIICPECGGEGAVGGCRQVGSKRVETSTGVRGRQPASMEAARVLRQPQGRL